MENRKKYRLLVIILFIFLLSLGIFVGLNMTYNNSLYDNYIGEEQKDKDGDNNDINIYGSEPVSTKKYNIDLVYIDEYTLCGETIKNEETIYDTTLADLKLIEENKQLQENTKYEILEESNERLVYSRKLNQNCPNHFIVQLEEGKIVVYNVVSESVKTKYQEIDISTELIRPELMEELNVGIKANSHQELNFIIEDIES